jgi:hypothetical protein
MDVKAEHSAVTVGKILNQEFWHPMLVLVGHEGHADPYWEVEAPAKRPRFAIDEYRFASLA